MSAFKEYTAARREFWCITTLYDKDKKTGEDITYMIATRWIRFVPTITGNNGGKAPNVN